MIYLTRGYTDYAFDYNFKYYNYRLVLYMVALSVIGILVVASASGQDSSTVTKQIIGIMVGFALAIGLSIIDYHRIINLYALDYAVCILLLGAVLVMGHTAGGATRWIDVPGIGRIQPSEFVKIGLIVFFSWYWNKYQEKMNMPVMVGIAAILAVIPIALIFAEPNLSTSLVVIVIILCMVYTAGISYRWIGGVLAVAIPAGALFIYLLTQGLIPFIPRLPGETYSGVDLSACGTVCGKYVSAEEFYHGNQFRTASGKGTF